MPPVTTERQLPYRVVRTKTKQEQQESIMNPSSAPTVSHSNAAAHSYGFGLFDHAFFAPWGSTGLYRPHHPPQPHQAHVLCDYVVCFRDVLILINTPSLSLTDDANLATRWLDDRKQAVIRARKRLEHAEQWLKSGALAYLNMDCTETLAVDISQIRHIYKICVTSATEHVGGQSFPLLHAYGSTFYHEECVTELSDNPVQLFSAAEFGHVIETLDDFDDFLSFLAFHAAAILNEDHSYASEVDVMERFINSGWVWNNARHMQQQQQRAGLISAPTPLFAPREGTDAHATFKTIRAGTAAWDDLTQGYRLRVSMHIQQQRAQGLTVAAEYTQLLSCLSDESLAGRWLLSQALWARHGQAEAAWQSVQVLPLRSCTRTGRHYLFCFYAEQPPAQREAYRLQAKAELRQWAEQVNQQAQQPHLDEIVVLGVQTDHGQASSIDIVYKRGHALDGQQVAVSLGVVPAQTPSTQPISEPTTRVGRNDICPCESAQRFKHCCGQAQPTLAVGQRCV
jgi:hypothetical protein